MKNLLRVSVIPAVLLAFMLIAACGGTSDEDQIKNVIQTSVKSTDPADCTKLQTLRFAEQTELAVGPDAIQQCRADAADTTDNPDSVDVNDVKVDGTNGTANVTFHGGSFDGSTLTVALVKVGDQWKLDRITAIPTFNLASFVRSLSQRLAAQGKTPATVVTCIIDALNKVGADQVKAALLSGDSSQVTALFAPCGAQ
jgi:hypothetical protein